jgi:hypothetical protein
MQTEDIEIIKQWLNAEMKDYNEGARLLQKYGPRKMWFGNIYRSLDHARGQEKLTYELSKLVPREVLIPVKTETKNPSLNTHDTIEVDNEGNSLTPIVENYEYKIKYENLPADMQALVIEKGQLYDKSGQLKKKMINEIPQNNETANIAARKLVRFELESLYNRILLIHQTLYNFENNVQASEATGEKENKDLTDAELQVKITKLRSAKSMNDKRAAESNKPDVKERNAQGSIDKQKEIEEIENLLNARKSNTK